MEFTKEQREFTQEEARAMYRVLNNINLNTVNAEILSRGQLEDKVIYIHYVTGSAIKTIDEPEHAGEGE